MANNIARLGVLLSLDSAEFQKALNDAGKKLNAFVEKAQTTAKYSSAAFVAMTYSALNYADQLSDVAKANDVTIDSVVKLSKALEQNGGNAENATKMLSGFTNFMDKAAGGSFEAQKAMRQVGVTLKDLASSSVQDLFKKTVEQISKIEDPLTRNAKAFEIFGKSAKGVDFSNLNNDLEKSIGLSTSQGDAVGKMADAMDMLKASAQELNLTIAENLGPTLKLTLEYIKELKGDGNLFGDTIKKVFQTIIVVGATVVEMIKSIGAEINHTIENAKLLYEGFKNLDFDKAIKANEKYAEERAMAKMRLDAFTAKVLGTYGYAEKDPRRTDIDQLDKNKPTGRKVILGIDPAAEAARKKQLALELKGFEVEQQQLAEIQKQLAENQNMYMQGVTAQMEKIRNADKEIDRNKEMLELTFKGRNMRAEDLQFQQELLMIEYKRKDNIENIKNDTKLDNDAKIYALQRENELAEKSIDLARQRLDLTKQTRMGTFQEGFDNAMATAMRNATTEFERGQQAFESVMQNMESALEQFVKTGKFNFKDFAKSVIQDLLLIQMKAQMKSMMGGGGGLSDILGSLFGGGKGLSANAVGLQTSVLGYGAYAEGGNPPVGVPSIVGENGPELFIPKSAGTVIPNGQMSGMMGGQTVNYNGPYIASMNAIDTQSGVQFLAKNKQTIWASYQSANRGVPVSR